MLPRWAQNLLDQHPGADAPTQDVPIPYWLEEEVKKKPLWYIIRESEVVRHQHPFVVYDEILKEPAQWADILATKRAEVDELAKELAERGIRRVIFTGCGSAFFTAIHGSLLFRRFTDLSIEAIESYELVHYFPHVDASKTVVIAHSGTGGSIETLEAIRTAKARNVLTVALLNTDVSPILSETDRSIVYLTRQHCGPCISVISTRLLLQTLLAQALATSLEDRRQLDRELVTLPEAGHAFLDEFTDRVEDFAHRTAAVESVFLVGSGPNYFSAREGTLKIEEQSLLVGKTYRAGDFHHDALSLLSPSRLVVAIAAAGAANARIVDAVRAAKEGLSPTLGVEYGDVGGLKPYADETWWLRAELGEYVAPVLLTLPFQLLGYFMGVARGRNPDTLATDHLPNARAWLTAFPLGTH
jgi:glucosamine--fructose-6-phosphate aminotransferase (isomerizing)